MKENHKKIVSIKVKEVLNRDPLRYATLECGHTQLASQNRMPGDSVKCGQCRREYTNMLRQVYPAIFR